MDNNGTVETFNTVALLREFEADLLLFPNPANSIVSLQAKNDLLNPRINIENAVGTIVYQNSFQTAKSFVLNSDLVPGIYWVSIAYEDELLQKD
ncbi:T9SS type A sorting domain-containing protein [Crocinitomicaceae bacterium]|nr:T9SS type A sorting domain-containing protein [Crocinitomicaceae bacterium]